MMVFALQLVKHGGLTLLLRKNGRFTLKSSGFTVTNGDLPSKNGGFTLKKNTMKPCGFAIKNGWHMLHQQLGARLGDVHSTDTVPLVSWYNLVVSTSI